MSAELAFQKGLRDRLIGSGAVTALVPAANILDRNERPLADPAIIIGEGQSVDDGAMSRNRLRIYMDLHIWKREEALTGARLIGSVARAVLNMRRPVLEAGYHCGDCFVSSSRFLRDPSGELSHGVLTVEAIVEETE